MEDKNLYHLEFLIKESRSIRPSGPLMIAGKYASGFYGQTVTSWRHKPIGPPNN